MAIFIRTGANGSYKSAYTAYFVIYEALKAGRVVVTNIDGMQPIEIIQERFDMTFPSTAKLIRITSRDPDGLELWRHFFCWCPIGALIVIDECQDIYSSNVGFRIDKVMYRPLSDFLDKLPDWYESFFYSRYVAADMSELDAGDIDDRGRAQYDDEGRIFYPQSFNEGFMRHRHYNWDIHLLSPDWGQIDRGIKACAEECYFHKGRDAYFFAKRKPYIYKHKKNVTTPVIPKGKDPNLMTQHIPLDAHLLYKSTSTGKATQSGGMNMLMKNPKILAVLLMGLLCMGYFGYALSDLVFGGTETMETASSDPVTVKKDQTGLAETSGDGNSVLRGDRHSDKNSNAAHPAPNRVDVIRDMLGLVEIQNVYYMGHTTRVTDQGFDFFVTLEAVTPDGVYHFNDNFLRANEVAYVHHGDCLLKLTKQLQSVNVFCKPVMREFKRSESKNPKVSLF